MTENCSLRIDTAGIATLTLNRRHRHNALNQAICAEIMERLQTVEDDPRVRVVMLASAGPCFCTGLDLDWLHSATDSHAVAKTIAEVMWSLHHLSKPTLAVVNGLVVGGGVGLVACCDIAVASHGSNFRFSEVRLGLIPSVIAPYIIRSIGQQQAKRYFLTAETFGSEQALHLGLIHELTEPDQLDSVARGLALEIIKGGPGAIRQTLKLFQEISNSRLDQNLKELTVQRTAKISLGDEAREGVCAFMEKRLADWIEPRENDPA